MVPLLKDPFEKKQELLRSHLLGTSLWGVLPFLYGFFLVSLLFPFHIQKLIKRINPSSPFHAFKMHLFHLIIQVLIQVWWKTWIPRSQNHLGWETLPRSSSPTCEWSPPWSSNRYDIPNEKRAFCTLMPTLDSMGMGSGGSDCPGVAQVEERSRLNRQSSPAMPHKVANRISDPNLPPRSESFSISGVQPARTPPLLRPVDPQVTVLPPCQGAAGAGKETRKSGWKGNSDWLPGFSALSMFMSKSSIYMHECVPLVTSMC